MFKRKPLKTEDSTCLEASVMGLTRALTAKSILVMTGERSETLRRERRVVGMLREVFQKEATLALLLEST